MPIADASISRRSGAFTASTGKCTPTIHGVSPYPVSSRHSTTWSVPSTPITPPLMEVPARMSVSGSSGVLHIAASTWSPISEIAGRG